MTLDELKEIIHSELLKRDINYEMTEANARIYKEKCAGTYEAVLTGDGQEKCLIPDIGTLKFLYRGQNKEFNPCYPSLYRGDLSDVDIFVERMRLTVFERLLNSHPVVTHFFKRHNFKVDVEGLAQHYGLRTSVLDLTSSLDIALFFATCIYNRDDDCYSYYDDGKIHDAILYVFSPILDNEPSPAPFFNFLNGNIRPIGLQPFQRPGVQEGYGIHMKRGESIKCYMYRFTFTCEDSKHYYDVFKRGEALWVKDKLVSKVKTIVNQKDFSFSVFNDTYRNFKPSGYSASKLKKALPKDISLKPKWDDVVFSIQEQKEIIEDWNTTTGPHFASIIRRRPWYNHDEITSGKDGKNKIEGIRNNQDYRSLALMSIFQHLILISHSDTLQDAEWVNYMNTPRRNKSFKSKQIKVPPTMMNMFGQAYLTENDWKIDLKE